MGAASGVPSALTSLAGQYTWSSTDLNYALFMRPSALSSAGSVAVDEWWGHNYNGKINMYINISDRHGFVSLSHHT